jgi:hypothetical protein
MPVQKRWSRFTRANVERLPNKEGMYELANAQKRIIDIGGSNTRVKARLMSHLTSNKYPTARYFRCEYVDAIFDIDSGVNREARHVKHFHQQRGRKPKYTKRSPRLDTSLDL